MRASLGLGLSWCVLLLALGPVHAQDPMGDTASMRPLECTAPPEMTQFRVRLPNVARTIRLREPLTIVAIGSSSTEGVGASDPNRSYPVQFAAALRRYWPDLDVQVINKGIGGEDAGQMVQRFERDVLRYKPQLVIWQVGSNYALRSQDVEAFSAILRKGINRLKSARTDVVLMDLQFAPTVLAKPIHRRTLDTMGSLANDLKVAVFRRFAIMRHWISSGNSGFEDIIARDRLHMNDASYSCIGRLLADSVHAATRAMQPSPAEGAAAARSGSPSRETALR